MIDGVSKITIPERTAAAAAVAKKAPKKSKRLGEVAGGAAAGCAAVVCCCPCGLIGLILLTAASVPAEIGRRIARKRKQRAVSRLLRPAQKSFNSVAPASMMVEETGVVWPEKSPAVEVSEMEEKMWAQFSGTGFWRSPSQRE
ncbi:hypothetical protein M5K25_012300 [Dendrobium thyrsiflorum]|uniref:Pollen preferential protein n=1 Tax=Dendrobium thyrsiflorum TaxID=117978 RepID=A0ABD0UWS1_DENTH